MLLPLYIFCGRHLLAAKLRRSDIDASAGAVDEVARIVAQIRVRASTAPAARWRTGSRKCQIDLFADRTSAATMRANQLRLWFASAAYALLCALRRIGLTHTQFATPACSTIRLRLLKVGALVRVSVRRVSVAMASGCPWQDEWALAHATLRKAGA